MVAHLVIASAIDDELIPALERATGESVHVERIDVSLFGSVAVVGVELGDFIAVDRVEGRVALSSFLAGRLSADEIEVENPRVELRQGGRRLRQLVKRLHASRQARGTGSPSARDAASPRWPRVRVSGGEMRVRTDRGVLALRGLRARPIGSGLRIITDAVELVGELKGHPLELRFARAAADVDTASGRVGRAVALAGAGRWGQVAIGDVSTIRDDGVVRVRSRIDGGELSAQRMAGTTSISFSAIPATALAPLLGSLELSRGSISGSAAITDQRARASLRFDGVDGQLPWLAAEPVDLSSEVELDIGVTRRAGITHLDIARIEMRRGALTAVATGAIASFDRADRSGQLSLEIKRAPCTEILASLPHQLAGALRGTQLAGNLEARFDIQFDLAKPAGEALSLAVALDPKQCAVRGEAPRFEQGLAANIPVRLAWLPPHIPAAFLAAEDSGFYRHRGFEKRQIEISLAQNLKANKLLRGGSTITQQLAKNLFLGHERTLARKLQEAVFAWRLEETSTKREILERYLGIIQLGTEVRGLPAASRHWFSKASSQLSPREVAFLACLTRAPATLERAIRANGGPTPALARRIDSLLGSLRFAGAISMPTYRRAMAEQLTLSPLKVAAR